MPICSQLIGVLTDPGANTRMRITLDFLVGIRASAHGFVEPLVSTSVPAAGGLRVTKLRGLSKKGMFNVAQSSCLAALVLALNG